VLQNTGEITVPLSQKGKRGGAQRRWDKKNRDSRQREKGMTGKKMGAVGTRKAAKQNNALPDAKIRNPVAGRLGGVEGQKQKKLYRAGQGRKTQEAQNSIGGNLLGVLNFVITNHVTQRRSIGIRMLPKQSRGQE